MRSRHVVLGLIVLAAAVLVPVPTAQAFTGGAIARLAEPSFAPDRLGPSIAMQPSGEWRIAFQANTGVLWTRWSDVRLDRRRATARCGRGRARALRRCPQTDT
jgi:hypothetical protein